VRTYFFLFSAGFVFLASACLCFAAEMPVSSPEDVGLSSEKLAMAVSSAQGLVDDEKITGASILVARKGKVVLFETLGMMDYKANKPMQPDTIFRIYSMSKPITSVAVMMLYEQNKLELDDPVSKYIRQFEGLKVYAKSGKCNPQVHQMSVRDLLRHTSGLTYGLFGNTAVDKRYKSSKVLERNSSLEEMINKLSDIPLLHQPRTKWQYSVSTDVLGYLVQEVSGQSLDEFFRQNIFEPLDMKDTAFYVPKEKADRLAACYGPKGGGGLKLVDNPAKSQYLTEPGLFGGGHGLVSTARDYLRFSQMLLNKGQLDGKRLLRCETVEMMTTDQLPDSVKTGQGYGFGLGFYVKSDGGKFPQGEYGWEGAASTHFWISPKDDLIVIALSQHRPASAQLKNAVKSTIYDSRLNKRALSRNTLKSDGKLTPAKNR
jgi:CubicO group peptidase (beta-lactamase class C family)